MKKAAICGAGLSGLACAFRLEQLGFNGVIDIYEEREGIGVGNVFAEFASAVFHPPIRDFFEHLSKEYQLHLEPLSTIYSSKNYGSAHQAVLKGYMGQVVVRGRHELALERQIYKQLKTPLHFNSKVVPADLMDQYDAVFVATGKLTDLPEEMKVRLDRYVHFCHGIAKGSFYTDEVQFWLNERYAPKGYGYCLPIAPDQAMISIVTADTDFDIHSGWERFIKEAWDNKPVFQQIHELRKPIGEPETLQYKNIWLLGNAAGVITPAMGFGLHTAILSGLYAAEAFVQGKDYSEMMSWFKKEYKESLSIRNAIEMLDQQQLDRLIAGMGTLPGKAAAIPGGVNFLGILGKSLALLTNETKKSEETMIPSRIPPYTEKRVLTHQLLKGQRDPSY